jgi:hypothetical protein
MAVKDGFLVGKADLGLVAEEYLTILNRGVTEGCEVQGDTGQEAFKQAGPVLHPLEPGLHQGGQLGEVAFGQVGQRSFRCDHTSSTGFSSCAYGGSWQTVSQSRAAISSAIARLR